ncbi:MAG: YkgJ family cysteine cluster protein [Methylophilales bacterium]|nr:YkgJ family cysteine cluster protein [Methylophilales bacterium]
MSATDALLSPEEQAGYYAAVEKVQNSVASQLSANPSKTFAITFVSNVQRSVDMVSQQAISQGEQFDCKVGCSHCCHVRVEAIEPEIFQIAHELNKLPSVELASLIERLQKHAILAKDLSVQDHRIPCPLLKDNLCSIYPVRPAACRKVHSYDVEKCKTRGSEIPESLEVILKSETLMKGAAEAYRQVNLPASGHELGQALLLSLTDETAEARWYGGEMVFDT